MIIDKTITLNLDRLTTMDQTLRPMELSEKSFGEVVFTI